MATEAPDPKTFDSWEDAFQYAVPAVRRMEQQLRADLDVNKDRLTSLVGASYRDLLGTAERIVDMDSNMRRAELKLGAISARCSSKTVNSMARNLSVFDGRQQALDHQKLVAASLLSLLQGCTSLIRRLLRLKAAAADVLLAAKVLVVSRHVHQTLARAADPPPPFLDALRDELAQLRQKLQHRVSRHFASLKADVPALVDAMAAFSLATSSSVADVLRRFHRVRSDSILARLQGDVGDRARMLQALRLYFRTLRHSQLIFPKRLAELLLKLKSRPLLRDGDVCAAAEISLALHRRWIPDDIHHATPWMRHDDLTRQQAEELGERWSLTTFKALLPLLRHQVSGVQGFADLLKLRMHILRLCLQQGRDLPPTLDLSPLLDDLRQVLNQRLIEMIRSKGLGWRGVHDTTAKSIDDARIKNLHDATVKGVHDARHDNGTGSTSLWDLSSTASMDLSDGAIQFRQELHDQTNGLGSGVKSVLAEYKSWVDDLEGVSKSLSSLRDQKWTDDADDVEDDESFSSFLELEKAKLNVDDPRLMETELKSTIAGALRSLEDSLAQIIPTSDAESDSGWRAVFLTRIVREMRRHLPLTSASLRSSEETVNHDDASVPSWASFGLGMVDRLHRHVAQTAMTKPLDLLTPRRQNKNSSDHRNIWTGKKSSVRARQLWEPSPTMPQADGKTLISQQQQQQQLPTQPTPTIFKFLVQLVTSMAEVGPDLWSPSAVVALKRLALARAGVIIHKQVVDHLGHLRSQGRSRPTSEGGETTGQGGSEATGGDGQDGASEEKEEDQEERKEEEEGEKADTNGDQLSDPMSSDQKIQCLFDIQLLRHILNSSTSSSASSLSPGTEGIRQSNGNTNGRIADPTTVTGGGEDGQVVDPLSQLALSLIASISESGQKQDWEQEQKEAQEQRHSSMWQQHQQQQLNKNVAEYARKTSLLFALLLPLPSSSTALT
ncbi:MAG: hypothetical protein M1825_004529 [Sarcosagium campestre]|nr:MAG: hypothetical protein M1825_004529 [Sarcosagium campestre]